MKTFRHFLIVIAMGLVLFDAGICFSEDFRTNLRSFANKTISNTSETVDTSESETAISYDGTQYSNNSFTCLYYEMLNEEQQQLYGQIVENIENTIVEFETIVTLTPEQVTDTVTSIYYDHPEFFWLDTNFKYAYSEQDGLVRQITLSYNETINDLDTAKQEFKDAANAIIVPCLTMSTDFEKEKYVHDTLLELVSYDENAVLSQSAYSALVNHNTVCAGYTKSFQYIMNQLGIPTYYVVGIAEEDHSWNIILLDGEYYNVDCTWDDQDEIIYAFFNVDDEEFNLTHTRTELSVNLPACTGQKYKNTAMGLFSGSYLIQ